MRVTLITTVRHNIGDDFVRVGMLHLLRRAWLDVPLTVHNIHKHASVTVRVGFGWVRSNRISPINIVPRVVEEHRVISRGGLHVLNGRFRQVRLHARG